MAGAATVALTYTAELKDLKKKLKEIPDLSAAEVREAIKSMNRAVKAGEKHASKTAKAAERAARESARATREGFKGIVELAGFSGDKVDNLSTVLEAVSVPAGAVMKLQAPPTYICRPVPLLLVIFRARTIPASTEKVCPAVVKVNVSEEPLSAVVAPVLKKVPVFGSACPTSITKSLPETELENRS